MNVWDLWKTDGTPSGTSLVATLGTGPSNSRPDAPVWLGGRVLFTFGGKLWASDGTGAGTAPIADAQPSSLVVMGSHAYFLDRDFENRRSTIRRTDGTASGTTQVATVPILVEPLSLRATSSLLYFYQRVDDFHDIWRTDGTPGGTFALDSGDLAWSLGSLVAVQDTVYYAKWNDASGAQVFRTEGTAATTRPVTGLVGSTPFLAMGPWLLLGQANSLISDGTSAGTRAFTSAEGEPNNGSRCNNASTLRRGAATLFWANDGVHGCELWSTDGTPAGTQMVKDITPGRGGSGIFRAPFVTMGPNAYFAAEDNPLAVPSLWRTDGTAAGTARVSALADLGPDPEVTQLVANGSTLYFLTTVPGSTTNFRLWKSNGTDAGTVPVTTQLFKAPVTLAVAGSRLFLIDGPYWNGNLWTSDGTSAGTRVVVAGVSFGSDELVPCGSNVCYLARTNDDSTYQPYASDGSAGGTRRIFDFKTVYGSSGTGGRIFASVNGRALMFAYGNTGSGVWAMDGTERGTVALLAGTDVLNGVESKTVGSTFYFAEYASYPYSAPRALFMTDGTPAGTRRVVPRDQFTILRPVGGENGTAFFIGTDATHGGELWMSTPSGNVLVQDFTPGSEGHFSNDVFDGTVFDAARGTAFMLARDARVGEEPHALAYDPALNVSFGAPAHELEEDGALQVAVERNGSADAALSVHWTTRNGTAVAGEDFGTAGMGTQRGGTLSWPAGDNSTRRISIGTGSPSDVPLIASSEREATQSFAIDLSAPTGGAVLGALPSAEVRILETDSLLQFAVPTIIANEESENVTLAVTRSAPFDRAVSVQWRAIPGTALGNGVDFGDPGVPTEGTLEFRAQEKTRTMSIGRNVASAPYIRIVNESFPEYAEAFTIELHTPSARAAVGPVSVATVTIANHDDGFGFAAAAVSVVERQVTEAVLKVDRFARLVQAVQIAYSTADGSARAGLDYTATAGNLNWAATDFDPKYIRVPIRDNPAGAQTRSFTVRLSATGVQLMPDTASVTIVDSDPAIGLSAAMATVAEGAGSASLSVIRTGDPVAPVSVAWQTIAGSAQPGSDFVAGSGTLSWAAGDASPKTISVPIMQDTTYEADETFEVLLDTPSGARLGIARALVTVKDDDAGIAFSKATYNTTEGATSVTLQVTRSGPAPSPATVTWTTVNGTATAGQDFGAAGNPAARSGALTWPAGNASPKSIVIPLLRDALHEGAEQFTVVLVAGAGATLAGQSVATVIVADDDIAPESAFSFLDLKPLVLENAGNALLTVRREALAGAFTAPALVTWAAQPGTALATSDYTPRNGTLNWTIGDVADKTISVPIVNNNVAEAHKSFTVTLATTSAGALVATPSAIVTILDDDEVFPRAGAIPEGWVVPSGAAAGWHVSNDPGAYEGVFSLRSDEIIDGQAAQVEFARGFAAGNVTFRVKVSSEAGFDKLRFFVDGIERATWSGTGNTVWQLYSLPIAAGTHTLRWSYEKDASASLGSDAAWIDALSLP